MLGALSGDICFKAVVTSHSKNSPVSKLFISSVITCGLKLSVAFEEFGNAIEKNS